MNYNQNKQYRISHTEEKIIDLIRDKKAWDSIYDVVMNSNSFQSYTNIKFLLSIFEGKMSFENDNNYKRNGKVLNVIKRLKETEFMGLMYIRRYGSGIFTNIKDECEYDLIATNDYLFKLYNLISRGISKTFDDLQENGFLTEHQTSRILEMLSNNESIFIGGDLNTGKITLLNAMVYSLSLQKRNVLILDEKSELQLDYLSDSESVRVVSYSDLNMNLLDTFETSQYYLVFTNLDNYKISCFLRAIRKYIVDEKVSVIGIFPYTDVNDLYKFSSDFEILNQRTVYTVMEDSKKKIWRIE